MLPKRTNKLHLGDQHIASIWILALSGTFARNPPKSHNSSTITHQTIAQTWRTAHDQQVYTGSITRSAGFVYTGSITRSAGFQQRWRSSFRKRSRRQEGGRKDLTMLWHRVVNWGRRPYQIYVFFLLQFLSARLGSASHRVLPQAASRRQGICALRSPTARETHTHTHTEHDVWSIVQFRIL